MHGSGSVTLTFPAPGNNPSTAGTLLVATILNTDPNNPFNGPPGWQLAVAAPITSGNAPGRAEIWHYPIYFPSSGNGGPAPGNPGGITSATFTTSSSISTPDCRGCMSEYTLPSGTLPVVDAPGVVTDGSGSAGSFSLTASSGNVADALGIAMVADFFSGSVSAGNSWTWKSTPVWTEIRHLGNGAADLWSAWYDLSLSSGLTGPLSVSFSDTSGELGYAFAFAAFRAVAYQAVYLGGGEMTNTAALDATGQALILGGDVEGIWRSADLGRTWQIAQDGVYGKNWRCTASVAWSALESNTVYACVGKNATGQNPDGGFMASSDGGITWSMRSGSGLVPYFEANDAGSPPRPSSETQQDADRSVGHLMAQDTSGGNLYVATYNNGVMRSQTSIQHPLYGQNWTQISPTIAGGFNYPRTLAIDKQNPTHLYVGLWNVANETGEWGGIWYTTNASSSSPTWSQLTLPSGINPYSTVSALRVIGGYLYAVFPLLGVYYYNISAGTWQSLNGGPLTTGQTGAGGPQLWTGLDGYVDSSGNHQIVVGCSNGIVDGQNANVTNLVQVSISPPGSNNISWVDLTGNATINIQTQPDGQVWWRYHADTKTNGWSYYLGGKDFVNPHVLINPKNPAQIFVTGAGGFFYTPDASATPVEWYVATTGAVMGGAFLIATDPNTANPNHVVLAGSDFTQIDLTDCTGYSGYTDSTSPGIGGFPAKTESHAVAFDSSSSSNIYTGFNQKYGSDSGGGVWYRATGSTAWNDTGYGAHFVKAPLGIYAGETSSAPYLVVATSAGINYAIPATGSSDLTNAAWSTPSSTIGTGYQSVQPLPIVADAQVSSNKYLYCFDRTVGVSSSAKHGSSWSANPIWTLSSQSASVNDSRSGWLAANPQTAGEIWVSTSTGLFRLTGANGGTLHVAQASGTIFPNGAGGLVFTPGGTLYAISLAGSLPSSSPQTSTQLYSLSNGSDPTVAANWANADTTGSIGSYVSWPESIALTNSGVLLVSSNPNFYVYQVATAP